MRTKQKGQVIAKKKSLRQSVREKDEYFRNTYDDANQDYLSLQCALGGTLDNYIRDRIHSCY